MKQNYVMIKDFYSTLNDEQVSNENYEHVVNLE